MPKTFRTAHRILFILNFFGDFLEEEKEPWGIFSSGYRSVFSFTPTRRVRSNFQQALYRLIRSGSVERKRSGEEVYLRLTSLGKNLLTKSFRNLNFRPRRHWDGHWRLVSFDVQESYRKVRGLLRGILADFGFIQFHQSLYLSAQEVDKELKSYLLNTGLERFVKVFVSGELGDDAHLAADLWSLNKLNQDYSSLLKDYEMNGSLTLLRAGFLELASRDPYLPQELLPRDWVGERVEELALSR